MRFRFSWIAIIAVIGCANACSAAEVNGAAAANATAAEQMFEVRGYRLEGNTVLPPDEADFKGDPPVPSKRFHVLTNYVGKITLARLREAVGAAQLVYGELGFATVGVTLPQQKLTNGIVVLKVVEGRLANILFQGNHYFSSNNVRRSLPGLATNVILNTKWFQPELDRANANQDRQIYPVISPGLDPGTSELTLKVKDRLPLHGHMEINDKSTPNTPLLRLDTALQYNNLWQLEHQAGLQYSFSPQAMKVDDYAPNVFDQPSVASYSGFYRLPLQPGQNLREDYDRQPVDFGYNEATHQFQLPPPTGNPEVIVFASRSASDTPPRFGPLQVITNTALADISQQSVQRDLTFNGDVGLKFTLPLREFSGVQSSVSFGFDYKTYDARSFSTNLSYFDLYSLDSFGNRVLVTNRVIPLGSNSRHELDYVPLSLGWSAARPDPTGVTTFSWNQSIFFGALASARTNFQAVAGSTAAGGDYSTATLGLTREQRLPRDWSLLLRANGQWATAPVISNEQFALGGTGGVRGYREGEVYGDTGWKVLFDLRAPPINIGYLPNEPSDIPAILRGSWFMDCGETYALDSRAHGFRQWGTGVGLLFNAGEHVEARLTMAWALLDSAISRSGSAQAYFSVGFQF